MKTRKVLIILTIFFAALTALLAVYAGNFAGIAMILGIICFIGLVISLVAEGTKGNGK